MLEFLDAYPEFPEHPENPEQYFIKLLEAWRTAEPIDYELRASA